MKNLISVLLATFLVVLSGCTPYNPQVESVPVSTLPPVSSQEEVCYPIPKSESVSDLFEFDTSREYLDDVYVMPDSEYTMSFRDSEQYFNYYQFPLSDGTFLREVEVFVFDTEGSDITFVMYPNLNGDNKLIIDHTITFIDGGSDIIGTYIIPKEAIFIYRNLEEGRMLARLYGINLYNQDEVTCFQILYEQYNGDPIALGMVAMSHGNTQSHAALKPDGSFVAVDEEYKQTWKDFLNQ